MLGTNSLLPATQIFDVFLAATCHLNNGWATVPPKVLTVHDTDVAEPQDGFDPFAAGAWIHADGVVEVGFLFSGCVEEHGKPCAVVAPVNVLDLLGVLESAVKMEGLGTMAAEQWILVSEALGILLFGCGPSNFGVNLECQQLAGRGLLFFSELNVEEV